MNKKHLYRIRLTIAILVFLTAIAGILGIFYPVRIFDVQFMPLLQRVIVDFSIIALLLLLIVCGITFLCGRVYCSMICPFGILQEITGFIKKLCTLRKPISNKVQNNINFPLKYFISAIVWGIFLGGSAIFIRYLDPYTVFGSAFSLTTAGLIVLGLVVIAVFVKNRIFCTNICPVGTILGLISKFSINKIYMAESCVSCGMCERNCPAGCINSKEKKVDNEICIKCLKCTNICPKGAMNYGREPKKNVKFNFKRRQIIIATAALALFGGMVKAGIVLKDKVVEKLKDIILPPGAVNKERFLNRCLNCNLCVENCPNKIIVKADDEYGAVHIDYSKGACDFNCHKCSQVCPSGAIKKLSLEEKQNTRIAMAMINDEKCTKCGLCSEACPVHAIIKADNNIPILNASKCIGCGNCKKACHFGAIEIFGVNEQKTL